MSRTVIDSVAAVALAPKVARRRRQNATWKLRPALEAAVVEFLHKEFGRKNAKLRHLKRVTGVGDIETADGTYLGEADYEYYEANIDRRYELVDLTEFPKRRRISRKAAFKPLSSRTDKELVDAILGGCLSAWIYRRKTAPSELSVAEAIAKRLSIEDESRFRVGLELAQLAVKGGIVRRVKRFNGPWCLGLTDEAAAALCDLESREEWPWPATGLHAAKITEPLSTQPGRRQAVKPHTPPPGTAPFLAAHRIRDTRWRINSDMLLDAGDWLQTQIDNTGGGWKAANEYTAELAAYRAITAKGAEQSGYLAVRYEHRGRINQVDSLVTYTSGADLVRGILEFDDGRPVETQAGRQALARHVLNQWSSTESRRVPRGSEIEWLEAHPTLEWEKAKHPLRCLAAIRAWNAAERGESIRLPVSIDATTSVLQHMALLLRDPHLAQVSNLWPNEAQRDFYTEVAERARLETMLPDELKSKAREVVKKITMPSFYGKGEWTSNYDLACLKIPKEIRARVYPAMMEAARGLAPGAFGLYGALCDVGGALALRGEPVQWRTLSGWEGCTARLEQVEKPVDLLLSNGYTARGTRRVNGKKLCPWAQAAAITANLIHSLDATLLHLAVRALPETVSSIAVAHDCFAVHADDVPMLRETLMRALGQMYAETDLLADWWAAWGIEVPLPERGIWDGRFLAGAYAFS